MRRTYIRNYNRYPHANHYIRDAIMNFISRVLSIAYTVIPVLVILSMCEVIKIDVKILIGAWLGYQFYLFISDIVDELIDKHDEKENESYYENVKFNAKPDTYEEMKGE